MRHFIKKIVIFSVVVLTACKEKKPHQHREEIHSQKNSGKHTATKHHEKEVLILSKKSVAQLDLKIAPISVENFERVIHAKGTLEIPPQNEAKISPMTEGFVSNILVKEGDKVRKNEVLATIVHPNIIRLQGEALQQKRRVDLRKQNYLREKALVAKKFGKVADLQRAKTALIIAKNNLEIHKKQLEILGLSFKKIETKGVQSTVEIKSPIEGFIEKTDVKIGEYVTGGVTMFEVFDIEHLHVDLKVFQKDFRWLKVGQKVSIKVPALPQKNFVAIIYAIGKNIEGAAGTLHIHAEFEKNHKNLIPGMYVTGKIFAHGNGKAQKTVATGAVAIENGTHYIFEATAQKNTWHFTPHQIKIINRNAAKITFEFTQPTAEKINIVQQNAYYLMAEKQKANTSHEH